MQEGWARKARYDLICVDSYDDGVLRGRLQSLTGQAAEFLSLSQLLLQIEERLGGHRHTPILTRPEELFRDGSLPAPKAGKLATFRLKVLFQEHTSWQGTIQWLEGGQEANFRSVLELVILMDSALRTPQK